MYSIGMFSQLGRVTAKALRHYDDIGLLKPSRIDPQSGYRYYSTDQLAVLYRIVAFKQMGLSLSEIMGLMDAPCETISRLLGKKRSQAQDAAARELQRVRLIENFLDAGKGFFMNQYTAMIKEIPEVCVAYTDRVLPNFAALNQVMPEMMSDMKRAGCKCTEPEYWFNAYLDGEYKERDIHVEVCRAVARPGTESGALKFKTLAGITAACVLHKGSYARLGEGYGFAAKWIEENGYKITGGPRESYLDGAWNKQDEAEYLTELQFPVERK